MMAVTRQKEMSVTWQAFVASAEICRTTNGTNKRKKKKYTNFIIFLFGRIIYNNFLTRGENTDAQTQIVDHARKNIR